MDDFLTGYLLTLKLLGVQGGRHDYQAAYKTFSENTFQVFSKNLMPLDAYDNNWMVPLLDHLASLLCKFAVLADHEVMQ